MWFAVCSPLALYFLLQSTDDSLVRCTFVPAKCRLSVRSAHNKCRGVVALLLSLFYTASRLYIPHLTPPSLLPPPSLPAHPYLPTPPPSAAAGPHVRGHPNSPGLQRHINTTGGWQSECSCIAAAPTHIGLPVTVHVRETVPCAVCEAHGQ